MRSPLVSVTIPCFNAAHTLGRALASLIAQRYERWEAIVVDDGSTDDPAAVVARANDPRIRLLKHPRNMGRGTARQTALDACRGDLLAMVDADDWIYPDKLARQVEVMEADRGLAVVSAGMAIVNRAGELIGVRSCGEGPLEVAGPVREPWRAPVAYGPAMLRGEWVRQQRYDARFTRGEDADFLLRLLRGRRYAILGDVYYVYAEVDTMTLPKILGSLETNRTMLRRQLREHPVRARTERAKSLFKEAVYRTAFGLGLGSRLIARRSPRLTPDDRLRFDRAREIVDRTERRIFGLASSDRHED